MTNIARFSIALILLTALTAMGCDQAGEPPATEILRVEVEPNPVAVGDTATFTCVIRDSLKGGFRFTWFPPNTLETPTTDMNQYQWVAPSEPNIYYHQVEVRDQNSAAEKDQERFKVTVTKESIVRAAFGRAEAPDKANRLN